MDSSGTWVPAGMRLWREQHHGNRETFPTELTVYKTGLHLNTPPSAAPDSRLRTVSLSHTHDVGRHGNHVRKLWVDAASQLPSQLQISGNDARFWDAVSGTLG